MDRGTNAEELWALCWVVYNEGTSSVICGSEVWEGGKHLS